MRIDERQRQFRSLKELNPAWKILARESSPMILAFLADLFENAPEVPMEAARARLMLVLEANDFQNPQMAARAHISNWIDDGLLREQNQHLTITAATQTALQFVESLGSRDLTATASHLETVNEEMRRLLVTLSPDIEERQRLIDEQIADLEAAKLRLLQGKIPERTPAQKREHVRHVYSLAVALNTDFRFLEDEMRRHEMNIHQRILDDQESRGSVLGGVLDAEDLMNQSPAGQAFQGFYDLLASEERSTAFRAQVKRLLSLGVAQFLSDEETRYLQEMVTELLKQSDRIIDRRRAATESLKAYMLSGNQEEHRAIDRLLKSTSQLAGKLREVAPADWAGWKAPAGIVLDTGKFGVRSPAVMAASLPDSYSDGGEIVETPAGRSLNRDTLGKLCGFSIGRLAERTRETLRQMGNHTIGELSHLQPIRGGIEEVIALLRLAKATGGIPLADTEEIYVTDAQRGLIKVRIPSVLMRPEGFPDDISDLNA